MDKITDNVTRMFLGVQLRVPQCHNHPFVDYKQNEYWGMAQFFINVKVANQGKGGKGGKGPNGPSVYESSAVPKGKKGAALPTSAKNVPAKFLRGDQPKISPNDPARPVLAQWLTSANNPYFAKAMVNRFWHQSVRPGIGQSRR